MKLQFITLPAIYEITVKTKEQEEIDKLLGEDSSPPPDEETNLTKFRVDQIFAHSPLLYAHNDSSRWITIMWAFGYRYHVNLPYNLFQKIFEKAVEEYNKLEVI